MGDGNDWTVLDGDRVIGRIFLSPQTPPDRNWMWTITAMDYPRTIHVAATQRHASKQWRISKRNG